MCHLIYVWWFALVIFLYALVFPFSLSVHLISLGCGCLTIGSMHSVWIRFWESFHMISHFTFGHVYCTWNRHYSRWNTFATEFIHLFVFINIFYVYDTLKPLNYMKAVWVANRQSNGHTASVIIVFRFPFLWFYWSRYFYCTDSSFTAFSDHLRCQQNLWFIFLLEYFFFNV